MTFLRKLQDAQQRNRSMLCVGLDPDPARFPGPFQGDAARIFAFCARLVVRNPDPGTRVARDSADALFRPDRDGVILG